MKFIDCDYSAFKQKVLDKKVVLFGASTGWDYYLSVLPSLREDVLGRVCFIVDNDISKINKTCMIAGREFAIKNPDSLRECENIVILITVRFRYFQAICDQLLSYGLPDNIECFALQLLYETKDGGKGVDNSCVSSYFKVHSDEKIPAKIHSFWFSKDEKPKSYKKCIESWKRFCPEFEIYEWNSENYDVTKNMYMKQAFEHKKWAFASDYARLDVVYEYGGIYLDMDVELVAPINQMLCAQAFFCRQYNGIIDMGSGFGACKGDLLVKELLDDYENLEFILPDGSMDTTVQPARLGHIFTKHGLKEGHDSQVIGNTLILSNDYFTTCSSRKLDLQRLKGTEMGIHWHNGGWLKEGEMEAMLVDAKIKQEVKERYFVKDSNI